MAVSTRGFFKPQINEIFHSTELSFANSLIQEYKEGELQCLKNEKDKILELLKDLYRDKEFQQLVAIGRGASFSIDKKALLCVLAPIKYFLSCLNKVLSSGSSTHTFIIEMVALKQAYVDLLAKDDTSDIFDASRALVVAFDCAALVIEENFMMKKNRVILNCIERLQNYKMHDIPFQPSNP